MEKIKPSEVRTEAREILQGQWGFSALVALCFILIICAAVMLQFVHPLLYLVGLLGLAMPLGAGLQYIFLDMKRGKRVEISDLFTPFRNYVPILELLVLTSIVTAVGMLLFVVPGVILMFGLSMSLFILRDEPELGVVGSMKASWKMMDGHKMELFLLALSFMGWAILASITVVGILWLCPYMSTAAGCFYERLRTETI